FCRADASCIDAYGFYCHSFATSCRNTQLDTDHQPAGQANGHRGMPAGSLSRRPELYPTVGWPAATAYGCSTDTRCISGESRMTLSKELLDILVCPKCHSSLEYRTTPHEELVCHMCNV